MSNIRFPSIGNSTIAAVVKSSTPSSFVSLPRIPGIEPKQPTQTTSHSNSPTSFPALALGTPRYREVEAANIDLTLPKIQTHNKETKPKIRSAESLPPLSPTLDQSKITESKVASARESTARKKKKKINSDNLSDPSLSESSSVSYSTPIGAIPKMGNEFPLFFSNESPQTTFPLHYGHENLNNPFIEITQAQQPQQEAHISPEENSYAEDSFIEEEFSYDDESFEPSNVTPISSPISELSDESDIELEEEVAEQKKPQPIKINSGTATTLNLLSQNYSSTKKESGFARISIESDMPKHPDLDPNMQLSHDKNMLHLDLRFIPQEINPATIFANTVNQQNIKISDTRYPNKSLTDIFHGYQNDPATRISTDSKTTLENYLTNKCSPLSKDKAKQIANAFYDNYAKATFDSNKNIPTPASTELAMHHIEILRKESSDKSQPITISRTWDKNYATALVYYCELKQFAYQDFSGYNVFPNDKARNDFRQSAIGRNFSTQVTEIESGLKELQQSSIEKKLESSPVSSEVEKIVPTRKI